METINNTINVTTAENLLAINGTKPVVNDPEGLIIAYFSLFIMAIVPIYIGAEKSYYKLCHQKKSGDKNIETLSNNDAAMFPLYASAALFGLFLVFKIFSKDYINMLLSAYFFILGILSLSTCINPFIDKYVPDFFLNCVYNISITKEVAKSKTTENCDKESVVEKTKEYIFQYSYHRKHFIGLVLATVVGVWYLLTKNWIANNMFGVAFSINAIELMHLNKVITGCILLGGLFIYDIFWVFGTNVMVTVAKSFEAPIKLVFPRDLIVTGVSSTNFTMLGIGDIVVPGIFVALLLRFDHSLKKGRRSYFWAGYIAYIGGLMTTIIVMHVFRHAQPALLYLCPACLGVPILLSLVLGDTVALFKYEDNPTNVDDDKKHT